jgi:hypothetical protein
MQNIMGCFSETPSFKFILTAYSADDILQGGGSFDKM